MNDDELQLLADRLAADAGMSAGKALTHARKIGGYDEDIVAAAVAWAKTGVMPDTPVIADRTPAGLNKWYYAVQVFHMLPEFRMDKERTIQALKHYPGRQHSGPDSAQALGLRWRELQLRTLQKHLQGVARVAKYLVTQRDQEAVTATGLSPQLTESIESLSRMLSKLDEDYHDVLLTDEDKH